MPATTFFLVRHGLTDHVGLALCGTAPGFHLNAEGRRQAEQAAEGLTAVQLDSVISSPLERATETARPIADRHGLSVEVVDGFIEFDVGEWTGETFTTLADNPEWQQFNTRRSITRPPGGELMVDVQQRALAALFGLCRRYPERAVAVVSHADVIRAVLLFFLGMPIDFYSRIEILPCSISILDLGDAQPLVRQINGRDPT